MEQAGDEVQWTIFPDGVGPGWTWYSFPMLIKEVGEANANTIILDPDLHKETKWDQVTSDFVTVYMLKVFTYKAEVRLTVLEVEEL